MVEKLPRAFDFYIFQNRINRRHLERAVVYFNLLYSILAINYARSGYLCIICSLGRLTLILILGSPSIYLEIEQ